MDAYTYLFYGFGQVAYAVDLADGKVQLEEEKKLHEIVLKNLEAKNIAFDYSDIIFKILKKDHIFDSEQAYTEGIENIKLGDHLLTSNLKETFFQIMEEIADSFPPITEEEAGFISRFKEDLSKLGK